MRNGYTYLMPELADDLASGHNIVATVYAECHSMYRLHGAEEYRSLGETEFVRGQAAMSASGDFGNTRACDVMFGNIDLTLGAAVEPLLQQHIEASGGRFRGVRISSGWHEDERINNVAEQASILLDPRVHEAIAVINRMGLSLDCWLYHTQLDEFAQLIDAHPGLVSILNHVGSPILGGPYRGKTDEVYT
ncbi:MAG TPA: amidohydrolase, partial [Gammaproteobacteria bacterium]|nr:amidohydrolase [Gammaproteobacteria bacterium]